jgi:hypothetical protein
LRREPISEENEAAGSSGSGSGGGRKMVVYIV